MKLEKTTFIGLAAGTACICISILISEGGTLDSFVDWPSVLITMGGTIASTIVAYPWKSLKKLGGSLKTAFTMNKTDLYADVEMIIGIANTARREGLLALENSLSKISDPFMKKGIMLIVDGTDPEFVKTVMEAEIYFVQDRHGQSQAIFDAMASYAPAYGMIGTLIGLINMLKNLSNTDALGPSMAVALVTTFYGVILANLVFNPISRKLKVMTAQEALRKELLLEGLLSIQAGENPRIIQKRLYSFLSRTEIQRNEEKGGKKVAETNYAEHA
ncbi:MAG TPA: motility protein A [Feifaniaceae bacterium]|nr:motility protein A [Feifaniaceae bacterium]